MISDSGSEDNNLCPPDPEFVIEGTMLLKTNGNKYRIYSIKRPGHLLNFWTLRVGAYSR